MLLRGHMRGSRVQGTGEDSGGRGQGAGNGRAGGNYGQSTVQVPPSHPPLSGGRSWRRWRSMRVCRLIQTACSSLMPGRREVTSTSRQSCVR